MMSSAAEMSPAGLGTQVDVTVIIVNYNTAGLLRPCLDALRASVGGLALQVVIIDNASRDDSAAVLRREFSDCELVFNNHNVGFGRANNQALAMARGRYLLLLNTDAFVQPDTLIKTVRFMAGRPDCGLVGVRLEGRDGGLQPSCRYFPTPWNEFLMGVGLDRVFRNTRMVDDMNWDHASVRECDWVPGCYYLVRRDIVEKVGLFDPRFFLYYEEVDHCQAVKRAGWRVMFYPDTTVVHIGGESAKTDAVITGFARQISVLQIESALLYYRKHYGLGGLLSSVVLNTIGDALMAVKWVLRRKTFKGTSAFRTHAATVWSLLWRTRGATRPTR